MGAQFFNKNPGPRISPNFDYENVILASWEAQCLTLMSKSCLRRDETLKMMRQIFAII